MSFAMGIDALRCIGFGGCCGGRRCVGGCLTVILEEIGLRNGVTLNERLDGNGECVGLVRGSDLGGAGEAGTEFVKARAGGIQDPS